MASKKIMPRLKRMIEKAHEMGVKKGHDPFITLSFMALPVIPTDQDHIPGVFMMWKKEDFSDC